MAVGNAPDRSQLYGTKRNTFENVMLIMALLNFYRPVNTEFKLVPTVNEALVGESVYFDCTTTTFTNEVNWYHYTVGAKHHEDTCLYCLGKLHPQYKTRIEVERIDAGTFRMNIRTVQRTDAGKYICQDDGGIGDSLLAHLVVLESMPRCSTNIAADGVLGPNSCNLKQDPLEMSCDVTFYGVIPPLVQWKDARSLHPIGKGIYCVNSGYGTTCTLSMIASFSLDGASFVCETFTKKYNCSTEVIHIMHVNINNSVTNTVYDSTGTFTCVANSSQPCSYRWKWLDGANEEVVSTQSTLRPQKSGWHTCEAECNIRGKQCTVLSGQVNVSEPRTESSSRKAMNLVPAYSMIIVVPTLLIFVILCLINMYPRKHRLKARNNEENERYPLKQSRDKSIWDSSAIKYVDGLRTQQAGIEDTN